MVFDPAPAPTWPLRPHRPPAEWIVVLSPPPNDQLLGIHVLREGERIDHLAFRYLENPAGFWRICEMNGVMLVEAISEKPQISIPAGRVR
jgi:hypothetical protein